MSMSNPKLKSTKAGIALSAEARSKLQQLADWIERELKANQDPRVHMQYYGGVVTFTDRSATYVSPMGALVQMFQPFKLTDAKRLRYGMYRAEDAHVSARAASILGLDAYDYLRLKQYIYANHSFVNIVATLRTLK